MVESDLTCFKILREILRGTAITSLRIGDDLVEVRTVHLPDLDLQRYRDINLPVSRTRRRIGTVRVEIHTCCMYYGRNDW